jgi:hypothetical protein
MTTLAAVEAQLESIEAMCDAAGPAASDIAAALRVTQDTVRQALGHDEIVVEVALSPVPRG